MTYLAAATTSAATTMSHTCRPMVSPVDMMEDVSCSSSSFSSLSDSRGSSLLPARSFGLAFDGPTVLDFGGHRLVGGGSGISNTVLGPPLKLNRYESFGMNEDISGGPTNGTSWKRLETSATAILLSLKSAPVVNIWSPPVKPKQLKSILKQPQTTDTKQLKKTKKQVVVIAKKTKAIKHKPQATRKHQEVVVVSPDRRFPRKAKADTTAKIRAVSPLPVVPTKSKYHDKSCKKTKSIKLAATCKTVAPHAIKKTSPVTSSACQTACSAQSSRRHNANHNSHGDYNIRVMTDKDVLSGRGNGIAKLPGNVQFRKLIAAHRSRYSKCLRHQKCQIAQDIIDSVHAYGGRFLEQLEVDKVDKYRVMDHGRVMEKTSQALRERSSSKR